MSIRLGAAILAGGRSSRMGMDKALIKYRDRTLLDRLLEEFSAFPELIVSFGEKRLQVVLPEGVKEVRDRQYGIGPIEGLRACLEECESDYLFVCAVDMPHLTAELAGYIAEFVSSDYDCYVIRDEKHFHPLCAIYSRKILPLIQELIKKGSYRLMEVLEGARTKYIDIEKSCFSPRQVKNVNTRPDLREEGCPLVFCVSGTSNSGKTWLISRLINEFIARDMTVGVIKHDGHDHFNDREGSDTSCFSQRGAIFTAIYSSARYSVNARTGMDGDELSRLCPKADVIIFEGRKDCALPKLWTVREESFEDYPLPEGVLGVVSDSQDLRERFAKKGYAVFDCGDMRRIAGHIIESLGFA